MAIASQALLPGLLTLPGFGGNGQPQPPTPPATATTVTRPYQVSIARRLDPANQLVMGPGTPYQVEEFLTFAIDDVRTGDEPRPGRHGTYGGVDRLGSREETISVVAFPDTLLRPKRGGTSAAAVTANHDALMGAWFAGLAEDTPEAQDMILRYMRPGEDVVRRYYGRARKAAPTSGTAHLGYERLTLAFTALDPRQYADQEERATARPASGSGGLMFPATPPFTFGSRGSGVVNVVNVGNFVTPWVAVITGPVTNPRVVNLTTGQFVQVNTTLTAGRQLVLDFDDELVLLDGVTSRYGALAQGSEWWEMSKGTTSLQFDGVIASGTTPTLDAYWRAALA